MYRLKWVVIERELIKSLKLLAAVILIEKVNPSRNPSNVQFEKWVTVSTSDADGMCDPVPTVLHATPITSHANNGTIVVFTCERGFMFSSGMRTASAVCNGVQWSTVPKSCDGMFFLELHLVFRGVWRWDLQHVSHQTDADTYDICVFLSHLLFVCTVQSSTEVIADVTLARKFCQKTILVDKFLSVERVYTDNNWRWIQPAVRLPI